MKKKVVIVANFTNLPTEGGNSRFLYIADKLGKDGYDVELITSNFSHAEKKHRLPDMKQYSYKIKLAKEPGYTKNISFKRFYSHYVLSKNIEQHLNRMVEPDIIYCAVPSLSVAKRVVEYANENNIRVILDIQELWPESFKKVLKIPGISDAIFSYMEKDADYIYSQSNDIIATSATNLERALSVNNKNGERAIVLNGTDLDFFDKCAHDNWMDLYDSTEFLVGYVGTVGIGYDLKTVIDSIALLASKGLRNIKFIVMGDGPLLSEIKEYAEIRCVDCEFVGKLDYPRMVGKLCACNVAVNPIKRGETQIGINKVEDYAAASLPVLNTQETSDYKNLVEEYNIGFNCKPGNIKDFADKIELLYKDRKLAQELGKNNRKLAEEKFDRKKTYKKIFDIINNIE